MSGDMKPSDVNAAQWGAFSCVYGKVEMEEAMRLFVVECVKRGDAWAAVPLEAFGRTAREYLQKMATTGWRPFDPFGGGFRRIHVHHVRIVGDCVEATDELGPFLVAQRLIRTELVPR